MHPEQQPVLTRISRASKYLLPILYLALLLCALTLVLVSLQLYISPTSSGTDVIETPNVYTTPDEIASGALTSRDKWIVFSGLVFFSAFLFPGFWWSIGMVSEFRNHRVFTERTMTLARKIAWLYLGYFVLIKLATIGGLFTPEGMNLNINPYTVFRDFIFLGLVWLFAWLLEIGTLLKLDSELAI